MLYFTFPFCQTRLTNKKNPMCCETQIWWQRWGVCYTHRNGAPGSGAANQHTTGIRHQSKNDAWNINEHMNTELHESAGRLLKAERSYFTKGEVPVKEEILGKIRLACKAFRSGNENINEWKAQSTHACIYTEKICRDLHTVVSMFLIICTHPVKYIFHGSKDLLFLLNG